MEGLAILAVVVGLFALLAWSMRQQARAGAAVIGRSKGRRDSVAGLQDSDFDRILEESRASRR